MKTEDIKYMIDLYMDGELNKEKEPVMFSMLSQDNEAREYFKACNYLKNNIQQNSRDYSVKLDHKILLSVEKAMQNKPASFRERKISFYLAYSVAAVCIILALVFYNKSDNYEKQCIKIEEEVKQRDADLKLILNTLTHNTDAGKSYWFKPVITKANL